MDRIAPDLIPPVANLGDEGGQIGLGHDDPMEPLLRIGHSGGEFSGQDELDEPAERETRRAELAGRLAK